MVLMHVLLILMPMLLLLLLLLLLLMLLMLLLMLWHTQQIQPTCQQRCRRQQRCQQ